MTDFQGTITHAVDDGSVQPCQRCQERIATETWSDHGTLGAVHGLTQRWCLRCVTEVQLAFAQNLAAQIPTLERLLAELP